MPVRFDPLLGGLKTDPPGSYTHTQVTPALVWTITHRLGFKPNWRVTDQDGSDRFPTQTHPNLNTTLLTFTVAASGTATGS